MSILSDLLSDVAALFFPPRCPVCGGQMAGSRWVRQPGKRFMMKCTCPEHGAYLVRVRLLAEEDGVSMIRLK